MEFEVTGEPIKLGQLLKACGLAENGSEAKFMIQEGLVTLNGSVCTQRGKKCSAGDIVESGGTVITLK